MGVHSPKHTPGRDSRNSSPIWNKTPSSGSYQKVISLPSLAQDRQDCGTSHCRHLNIPGWPYIDLISGTIMFPCLVSSKSASVFISNEAIPLRQNWVSAVRVEGCDPRNCEWNPGQGGGGSWESWVLAQKLNLWGHAPSMWEGHTHMV